jgi:beta-glucosidase/6-phospho-beta-glucosidase/beta-galactosidase
MGFERRGGYVPPLAPAPAEGLFPTFFLGGFECSTFIWKDRRRRDYVVRTAHDRHLEADYERVQSLGLGVVREAVRWPVVDRGGGYYNWSTVDPVVAALNRYHLTPIWDLCHYGFPDGCNPLEEGCLERFVKYCRAVAEQVATRVHRPHYFTPVNEINFLSGAATDMGWVYPFAKGKYKEMKLALCRMAIEGAKAIREVLPEARMVHVDPIIHEVPPPDHPELADLAWRHEHVEAFEAWDILAGRLHPELGGSPEILDLVGVNMYNFCQSQVNADGTKTVLGPRDPRRKTLGELLQLVWERYRRPVIIGETSGYQDQRANWLRMVMEECMRALNSGVDLQGVCLYPVVDIEDWNTGEWAKIGIYDVLDRDRYERAACAPYVAELRRWEQILGHPEEVSTRELRTKRLGTVDLQAVKRYARDWEQRAPGSQTVQPHTDQPGTDEPGTDQSQAA